MFRTIRQLPQLGDTFVAACRFSQDVENYRRPNAADLDVFGIDAKQFLKWERPTGSQSAA
jgi:hypothetical protein